MRFLGLTILALAFATPAAAAPAPTVSEAETAALEKAVSRGRLIYAYDQAAWHGTDDLREKVPDFATKVGGWIVDGPADAAEIVFFDRDQADPKAVYIAKFENQRLVSSRVLGSADDRSLSAARKAMIAARHAAVQEFAGSEATLCKEQPPNTVVLPPTAAGEPTLVYLLTPQTDLETIPLGGHYRVTVTPDGRAEEVRPFSKSCIDLPLLQNGETLLALAITHLLDPVPTEIHVFSSLAAKLPLYVGTSNGKLWEVDGTTVGPLKTGD